MTDFEIRSSEQGGRILLQGLCLQRYCAPIALSVRPILEWALELVAEGHSVPPLAFVGDVGHAIFGDAAAMRHEHRRHEFLPPALIRQYEDHVLGRLLLDRAFDRAAGAVRQYTGRDRSRAVAYVLRQIQTRSGHPGAVMSPGIIKSLLEQSPEALLTQAWTSLEHHGLDPILKQQFDSLIASVRLLDEFLGPEDVFELEHGTALAELGQRVALRQVVAVAARFEASLSEAPPKSSGRRDTATRHFDEDAYPVGGFSSISNRGSLESLLQSQLAFMDTGADSPRPDLFDIKFVRDELLYYSRDENQFFRHRRAFVFALSPDLVQTRFKDPELPFQRIVLTLAFIVAAINRLANWLSVEALTIELHFPKVQSQSPLQDEREILQMILREFLGNGVVRFGDYSSPDDVAQRLDVLNRKSDCRGLMIVASPMGGDHPIEALSYLSIENSRPMLSGEIDAQTEALVAIDGWTATMDQLLRRWL